MGRCWESGLGCVSRLPFFPFSFYLLVFCDHRRGLMNKRRDGIVANSYVKIIGVLDREGNARKVVNCSCVVVRDWGEESQERSILMNYFATER